MKLIVLALILFLFNQCTSPTEIKSISSLDDYQWTQLDFPHAPFKHDDIYFISPDTGWVAVNEQSGSNRGMHKTTDGGLTWTKGTLPSKPVGGREFFRCIGFLNGQIGFVGNLFGTDSDFGLNQLYKTTDGGLSWQIVEIDSVVVGLCGISTVSPSTVYLAGRFLSPAYLVKSNDAGNTWSTIDLNSYMERIVDVKFLDKNHGFVIGGSHASHNKSKVIILETVDGGQTWIKRYEGPRVGEWAWKIQFLNENIVYVSIETDEDVIANSTDPEGEFFLKSTNGGQSWQRLKFRDSFYSSQGIGFINEQIGWMGSFDRTHPNLATFDGGNTWQEIGFERQLNRFRFFSDTLGYVSGRNLYKIRKIK